MNKPAVALLALMLTALPAAALADHRQSERAALGAALGAAVGAYVGSEMGGRDGAVVGGALGGAVGARVTTRQRVQHHAVPVRHHQVVHYPQVSHHHHHHHHHHRGRGHFCPPGQARKGRC